MNNRVNELYYENKSKTSRNEEIMNKEDEQKFKEIFNKSVDRLLDTLNNNPDELFNNINLSKQLANKSRQIYNLTKENTSLKQALNEIEEYINSDKLLCVLLEPRINNKGETHFDLIRRDISQIIDKYKKEDD